MRHVSKGWLSDICLCKKEFTDRMEYYSHAVTCPTVIKYRIASGQFTSDDMRILKEVGVMNKK